MPKNKGETLNKRNMGLQVRIPKPSKENNDPSRMKARKQHEDYLN